MPQYLASSFNASLSCLGLGLLLLLSKMNFTVHAIRFIRANPLVGREVTNVTKSGYCSVVICP
jgi:hypothetical protein